MKERKSKWTKETITEALDQFKRDNGRLPIVSELNQYPNLPPRSSLVRRFGMGYDEFLQFIYGVSEYQCRMQYYIEHFVSVYNDIEPTGLIDYNKRKPFAAPDFRTVFKAAGVKSWEELINKLFLKPFTVQPQNMHIELSGRFLDQLQDFENLQTECLEMDKRFVREGKHYTYLKYLKND